MAELHPDRARDQARKAYTFAQAFSEFGGKTIDWQSDEPWPYRGDLAHALEWVEELSAMVLNLADRVAATPTAGAQPLEPVPLEELQFLTDVVTAAGLLYHGKTCKALANRISEFAMKKRTSLYEPAARPATSKGGAA